MNINDSLEQVKKVLASTPGSKLDIAVERSGEKIILPVGVPFASIIASLLRRQEAEENMANFSHVFNFGVAEGAVAFVRMLENKFGFVSAAPTPGFFGADPPTYLGVDVSPTEKISVPWGTLEIPGIEGRVSTGYKLVNRVPVFQISATIKGKCKHLFDELAALTIEEYKKSSIYRGQALELNFPDLEDTTSMQDFFPKFMRPSTSKKEHVIFARDVERLVETTVFNPIEHTQKCRDHNIPLKRGVLLEGPYGVGKTLTAAVAQALCLQHGWTYLYIRSVEMLEQAVRFARNYQPAVIFAEDIDQVFGDDPDERTEKVNAVLNCIDGVDSKDLELMVILTTNNVGDMAKAMLRPGRIDTVIPVRAPDADAAIRLVRHYAGGLLADGQDLSAVGEELDGRIPAMIREVVERSKLSAVSRPGDLRLMADDLRITAVSMRTHMALLEDSDERELTEGELAAEITANAITDAATTFARALNPALAVTTNGNGKSHDLSTQTV